MGGSTPYTCSSCKAALDDADDTASKGYVKCRFCGEVTQVAPAAASGGRSGSSLGGAWDREAPPRSSGARRNIRIRPRDSTFPEPPGFTVTSDATTLTIVKRWRTALVGCLFLFALFWNGFVLFWNLGVSTAGGIAIVFHLFSIPFVLVGLGLIYLCAAVLVNRTTITASANVLSVRVGPLPWRGRLDVDPGDIERILVETRTRTSGNGTSTWSVVGARMRGGARRTLVSSVRKRDEAQFVAETLTDFLGIPLGEVATEPGGDEADLMVSDEADPA